MFKKENYSYKNCFKKIVEDEFSKKKEVTQDDINKLLVDKSYGYEYAIINILREIESYLKREINIDILSKIPKEKFILMKTKNYYPKKRNSPISFNISFLEKNTNKIFLPNTAEYMFCDYLKTFYGDTIPKEDLEKELIFLSKMTGVNQDLLFDDFSKVVVSLTNRNLFVFEEEEFKSIKDSFLLPFHFRFSKSHYLNKIVEKNLLEFRKNKLFKEESYSSFFDDLVLEIPYLKDKNVIKNNNHLNELYNSVEKISYNNSYIYQKIVRKINNIFDLKFDEKTLLKEVFFKSDSKILKEIVYKPIKKSADDLIAIEEIKTNFQNDKGVKYLNFLEYLSVYYKKNISKDDLEKELLFVSSLKKDKDKYFNEFKELANIDINIRELSEAESKTFNILKDTILFPFKVEKEVKGVLKQKKKEKINKK